MLNNKPNQVTNTIDIWRFLLQHVQAEGVRPKPISILSNLEQSKKEESFIQTI